MNRDKKWNILSLLVCVVLAVFLIGMLAWGKKADAAESRRLEQIAKEQENPAPEKEIKEAEKAEKEEPETKEAEEAKVEGIVCWGDDMVNGEASATHSYKVVLQNLLKEKGYNLPVQDKTLQGAGTLSMMTMAGVPEEEVQQFITKHQEAAAGAELAITETGIRDLTEEQKARTDLNCIPVICMGYYGGWSHDPAELAEQQQKILATFPNQDKFLIVGAIPLDGSVNEETLDQVLSEKWGEHYISAAQVSSSPAATYEGQEAIANAVVQKLEELNYIHKEG
ncbi:MAG: hypothetical protein KH034_05460 [Lachnospiraceae bacterium]|nr:hypothetical protein [Lachnospiraceae bacterium]